MLKLAALVGPTAVGKTSLSIALAQRLNCEIISCDSMQVYRGMDIGTAKASREEQKLVPHHLIDIINPDEDFTVADYQKNVKAIIASLNQQGKIPLLVGGTGLYYQAVVDDYNFFPMQSRLAARKKWENICKNKGLAFVYEQLCAIDPQYAQKISNNDSKRIIRALEVYDLTGKPFSGFQTRNTKKYNLSVIGLNIERTELYNKIEKRVEQMIFQGLIEEVIALREKGYGPELNSMQALGYKQVNSYLEGLVTRETMLADIKRETRRFAKRQLTWFRKDSRIHWINPDESTSGDALLKNISAFLEGQLGMV